MPRQYKQDMVFKFSKSGDIMKFLMKFFLFSTILFLLTSPSYLGGQTLTPSVENPWYWSYQGETVLLLGGSDDDNLFQWPEKKLISQLNLLQSAGGNVIRNTMSDRNDKGFETYPFKLLESGKYDLKQWNEEYWARFERLLRETYRRHIIVQIEIWDRFDYTDNNGSDRWQAHPYNPKNNINYSYEQSGFSERYPDHPGKNQQPFFFTTPEQRNNQVVLQFQKKFIDKLLDHSLVYDNVLYCMDNETNGEEEWGKFWAKYVKSKAGEKNARINVTEMWDDWDLAGKEHKRTFDYPELYDFVDVSQNNHNNGQRHWDNFLYVKVYLSSHPRPMNTTKTYGASGNKFGHTDQDGIERFWRHLLAGAASMRFHRPVSGLGLNPKAVACLKAARKLESVFKMWVLKPANQLLSGRDPNEAYLAASPGKSYAVYFPAGGEVSLDLSSAGQELILKWINIDTGEWGGSDKIKGGKTSSIKSPGEGNWIAAISNN
jgi:hypothetical protein